LYDVFLSKFSLFKDLLFVQDSGCSVSIILSANLQAIVVLTAIERALNLNCCLAGIVSAFQIVEEYFITVLSVRVYGQANQGCRSQGCLL